MKKSIRIIGLVLACAVAAVVLYFALNFTLAWL